MQYDIIMPPKSLHPYIKYFWTATVDPRETPNYKLRTLVDDSCGLIFQRSEGSSAVVTKGEAIPNAFLYGQITQPTASDCLRQFSCVGVLFHPYTAHELFGFNSALFADRMIDLGDLPEFVSLSGMMTETHCPIRATQRLMSFFERKALMARRRDSLVRDIAAYVRSRLGLLTVREIKEYFNISERTLERYFQEQIGVNPSHFIQITRFNEIIRRFRIQGDAKMIDIAYDLNFYDQSHFNSVVRKFANCSPVKLKHALSRNVVNVFLYAGDRH